jgi:Na+/H+ antiporter NhaD/arsenite permease-like protein
VHLAVPTLLNLFLTYIILRVYFRKDLLLAQHLTKYHQEEKLISHTHTAGSFCEQTEPIIKNPRFAKISSTILLITTAGFIISELLHFLHVANVGLSLIALLGAAALYLVNGSSERKDILRRVDYSVLVFFAALFVVTSALWSSGAISMIMSHIPNPNPSNIFQSNAIISAVSILLSQILEAWT